MTLESQHRRLNPRPFDTDWLVLKALHAAIASHIPPVARNGAVALDFGCGTRPYQELFTAKGVRYIGADFDGTPDIPIDASGRLQAADNSSDLLLSFQVLEHVRDLQRYLSEARRVLRPDGWMMLSTHGTWFYHPHPEDHRRWTREGLINDITVHGFEVTECVPIVGPLAWTTLIRLTCACYALRKIPVVGAPIGALLALIMNLRAKIEEAITPAWVTNDNACVYLVMARPGGKAPA
jgi:SAM-dependent methyltransferase